MIILPLGFTSEEIRVLQEYRRLNAEALPVTTISALKHPSGNVGEAPAVALADRGWLTIYGPRENYSLTPKAKDFLAIVARPMFEDEPAGPSAAAASAAAEPDADGA